MRIIGGALSGRRFEVPIREGTRPTSERVREALSSALQARGAFEDARVLDLFAGTGALAFEALSRGAAHAVLVERDRRAAEALRRSATTLGLAEQTRIVARDAFQPKSLAQVAAAGPFDLVFLDPPYAMAPRLGKLLDPLRSALTPGAWIVVEHDAQGLPIDPAALGLSSQASYRYGATAIELLTVQSSPPESIPA